MINMRTLSIDYGEARVGIAITDPLGITAQGLETIHHENNDKVILRRLEEKQIVLSITENANKYLIENGYSSIYGARPLKRFVQKKLETLIARKIMEQKILPKQKATIDFDGKDLVIK